MLSLNLQRVFALRGIERPFSFLFKNGFIRTTATKLLHGRVSHIKIEHIEKICVLLNCTPNDLFDWKAGKEMNLAESHALNLLKRESISSSFSEMVKDIPIEHLNKIKTLLDELKNQ